MPIIYDKDEKTAIDTESGASLSLFKSRRESEDYLFKPGDETLVLSTSFTFKHSDLDDVYIPAIRKTIYVDSLHRFIPGASEKLSHQHSEIVDYKSYKSIINSLLHVHNKGGNLDSPTEIVIDFTTIERFQIRRGVS